MPGKKRMNIGKISSLPISMVNERTNVDKSDKSAKLESGPNAPRPGPVFEIADTAAESADAKSKPSRVTTIVEKNVTVI